MNNKILFRLVSISIFIASASIFAQGQATRTWVSGVGDDVNPCSRTAPCKTFAGAISKTATGGEINCLDPGGYGSVTITKSMTIDCRGTIGSTLASATQGFIINIGDGDSAKLVRLRGLSISGAGGGTSPTAGRSGYGTGLNGVRILSAANVYIEDVVIDGFTKSGVSIENTAGNARVSVQGSSLRNNEGSGVFAFCVGGTATVVVTDSLISGNGTAFSASGPATLIFAGNTITFNKTAFSAVNGGKVIAGSNNVVTANDKDGTAPGRLP